MVRKYMEIIPYITDDPVFFVKASRSKKDRVLAFAQNCTPPPSTNFEW